MSKKRYNIFRYENTEQIFSDSVNESTDKILNNILQQDDEWSDGLPNEDDITLLVLRLKTQLQEVILVI